jgi:fructosamine-3-kinase
LNSGGWASVLRVNLKDGRTLAAKVGHPGHEHLMVKEAAMLEYLGTKTEILFAKVSGVGDGVLFLDFIENDGRKGNLGAAEAGRALAGLHTITSSTFGFTEDTIFGPTPQPNPKSQNWVEFFGQHRLLYMGRIAYDAGQISGPVFDAIQEFVDELENFLPTNPTPSLLHGDFWGGNILFNEGHLAAFIDPAIYYGDAEVDLAFSTLFGSLGDDFFSAYKEIRPIERGFEARIDIYNLWGLLFHAYWFGGGYAASVERILKRLGF